MRDEDVTHCQWAHCAREPLGSGFHYCRAHCDRGIVAERAASWAMLDFMDALPEDERKALWARIKSNRHWYARWWEPEPRPYLREPIPWGTKRLIAQRHGGQPGQVVEVECPRCGATGEIHWFGKVPRFVGMHIDHIRPVTKGGTNALENLRLLCPTCNISRGNREVA